MLILVEIKSFLTNQFFFILLFYKIDKSKNF